MRHEPRLKRLAFDAVEGPQQCPSPLPPSVYSRIDQAGSLFPFAAIDATRLALLHANPQIWPQLMELPTIAGRLLPDERLLAYVDAGGHRVVGPNFEGVDALSVCIYRHRDRFATFNAAATQPPMGSQYIEGSATLRWAEERGHGKIIKKICEEGCAVRESGSEEGWYESTPNGTERKRISSLKIDVQILRTGL
eukprot:gnl/TRDRNA2_/TRDRNA2_68342_c1_seq1.p1 gnl/TRDRNA2_/TRDRNA2_68342_c1~~gnl/TRDRNA2_/TRDRNA2_68342_c1_seq1.p1  ORF type:complete len:194 (+),score=34.11 gnl/TRDRNA2_/TRDRNA2_68342_c1_seq1:1-582(+)